MKPEELRLGNFVWNDTLNIAVAVTIRILNEQVYYKTRWDPVPLTEGWMTRFGFVYEGDRVYRKGNFKLKISSMGVFRYHITPVTNIIYLDFVHQLQNLYFALTGEELKLKS